MTSSIIYSETRQVYIWRVYGPKGQFATGQRDTQDAAEKAVAAVMKSYKRR
jgi:hypothetical protein